MNTHPTSQHGFTLIELSIVLIIISLVASAFMTLGIRQTEAAKQQLTETRLEKITRTLGMFVMNNGRLPCPAVGSAVFTAATYGVEDASANCATTEVTGQNMHIGAVPIITLGLSDEYIADGWNRRFTYAIASMARDSATFMRQNTAGVLDPEPLGTITVFADGAGAIERTDVGGTGDGAVMVLLSHGADGHGAWALGGGANRIDQSSADAAEIENAHDPTDDTTFDSEFAQTPRSPTYDDIVTYRQRWHIIQEAGGIIDDDICAMAWRAQQAINDTTTLKRGSVGCLRDDDIDGNFDRFDASCDVRQRDLSRQILSLCFIAAP